MDAQPSFGEFFRYWLRLGFINFGGPAGQIALMHKNLVDERRWIDESTFLRALNFCMLLPGPEAHQLAVYLGLKLFGRVGGLVSGLFFLLPSVGVMLGLSLLAATQGETKLVGAMFAGVGSVVVAVVIEAVLRIGKKSLGRGAVYAFAVGSFIAGRFLGVPFPLIVLAAGLGGLLLSRFKPELVCMKDKLGGCLLIEPPNPKPVPTGHVWKTVLGFVGLWGVVVGPFALFGGPLFRDLAAFFTEAAFVTFGGAYAVLSYTAEFAMGKGWVDQAQMILGLGLAETTPGPLVMVLQHVGFFAGFGPDGLVGRGIAAALLTTWCTFLPSFFFIFLFAPYLERITSDARVRAFLTGVSAAVVGVVANLAVFFTVHTVFPKGGFDPFALLLAAAACFLTFKWKLKAHWLVLVGAGAGCLRGLFLV